MDNEEEKPLKRPYLVSPNEEQLVEILDDFFDYIDEQQFPTLEGFANYRRVSQDILYSDYFYDAHKYMQSKVISTCADRIADAESNPSPYIKMIEEERNRVIIRSPQRMYSMILSGNWVGLPPTQAELFAVSDYERKLLSSTDPNEKSPPRLKICREWLAIYAGQHYLTIVEAIGRGKIKEARDGIILNSVETDAYIVALSQDPNTDKVRTQVKKNQLENRLREIRLDTFSNNLVSLDLVKLVYQAYMDNMTFYFLEAKEKVFDRWQAFISEGIKTESSAFDITKRLTDDLRRYSETKIKLIKKKLQRTLSARVAKFNKEMEEATIAETQEHFGNQNSEAASQIKKGHAIKASQT